MNSVVKVRDKVRDKVKDKMVTLKEDKQLANDSRKLIVMSKKFLFSFFKFIVLGCICYVILGPLIGIISKSFFSSADNYNPMVYLIPVEGTFERYELAWIRLDYIKTLAHSLVYTLGLMLIQIMICSMVGYGFARFNFPLKKVLYGCVVVMIVLPPYTVMLPLFLAFREIDPLGLVTMFWGKAANLHDTPYPMVILTLFGCGLRSGLYIYIFNQFFRGLPVEIEEAAYIDGAGMWYTYFNIMLRNALPSVVTVSIFAMVWQYNDTFYASLFKLPDVWALSTKISSLAHTISNVDVVRDPSIVQLYVYAGVILVVLPVILIYMLLQKFFIEGVERSGIVG